MKLATWHWHIEVSSKCTLKCPRCARQEVPDTLVNTELELEFFWANFPEDFIKSHVERITFCGDDGDPIYAHDLIEIIKYFKNTKPEIEIIIVTNGSYKSTEWWSALGMVLDNRDIVHFSIDGFNNETNNIYRINSSYDSIIAGIQALRAASDCQLVWAAIAFNFNQDHITQIQQQAFNLGMDRLQITHSTKFGSIYPIYGIEDRLQPRSYFVSRSHRFERTIIHLTKRSNISINETNLNLYHQRQDYNGITPLCSIGNKGLYINVHGQLFPCCWVANRYQHNNEWAEITKRFDLFKNALPTVLEDPFWQQEFTTFRWQECRTKCTTNLVTEEYATQW